MWSMALKFLPTVLGLGSTLFGKLKGVTDANKGASLATVLGSGGILANPEIRNFLAEMLSKAAELLKVVQ